MRADDLYKDKPPTPLMFPIVACPQCHELFAVTLQHIRWNANHDVFSFHDSSVCPGVGVSSDPLHQHPDGTWWWYEETWAEEHGPYSTEAEAKDALLTYCREVLDAKPDKG